MIAERSQLAFNVDESCIISQGVPDMACQRRIGSAVGMSCFSVLSVRRLILFDYREVTL